MNQQIKDIIARGRWQPIQDSVDGPLNYKNTGMDMLVTNTNFGFSVSHVAHYNPDDSDDTELYISDGKEDWLPLRGIEPNAFMPLPDEQLADLAEKQAELIAEFMLSENIEDMYHAKQKARARGYGGE